LRARLPDRVELLPAGEQALDLGASGVEVGDQRLDLGRAILEDARIGERGLQRRDARFGSGDGLLDAVELAGLLEGQLARARGPGRNGARLARVARLAASPLDGRRAALGVERVAALVERDPAGSLEGEDRGGDAVEEPAIVRDDEGAAREVDEAVLEGAEG